MSSFVDCTPRPFKGVGDRRCNVFAGREFPSTRTGLTADSELLYCGSFLLPYRHAVPPINRRLQCNLSVSFLAGRLPYRSLVPLLRLHGIRLRQCERSLDAVVRTLLRHSCDGTCPAMLCEFIVLPAGSIVEDISRSLISPCAVWRQYPVAVGAVREDCESVQYVSSLQWRVASPAVFGADDFAVDVPLTSLAVVLPLDALLQLAAIHGVVVNECNRNVVDVSVLLNVHQCCASSCERVIAVFRHIVHAVSTPSVSCISTNDLSHVDARVFTCESSSSSDAARFPSLPLSNVATANIVTDWCNAFSPSVIGERACAVCGCLVQVSCLSHHALTSIDLHPLVRSGDGVTCEERRSRTEATAELPGPVLYADAVYSCKGENLIDVCDSCLAVLSRHNLPRQSLANGLWIGDVPVELRNLSFVEKLAIARCRHNAFVVKVDKGQRKMRANAVVFAQPVEKFFDVLPPPRSELDLCLAVLFTGPCQPTGDDFKRTPLLLRHTAVRAALHWLRLNHADYRDVVVSEVNLATYSERHPPVSVIYRRTDGSTEGHSMSVSEADDELGTEEGMCSFAVNALTGADLADMTYNDRVARALNHFHHGGRVLAYGHAHQPESIFDNPHLYPSMFPWLFPFGIGGIGNDKIQVRIDRRVQVRHLLMYADRRFQTDEYFAFVAFNQEQIRSSSLAGYLLTQKKHMTSVVDQLLNIDMVALQRLVDRGNGSDSKYLAPNDDAERDCFKLLNLVDHVAGHVDGSATARKYQRSEIRSMIIKHGMPIFFVTFAPVDFKHPLCLYYCGERIDLGDARNVLRDDASRLRVIAQNPVACARFFHAMVVAFLKYIVRAGTGEDGVFGQNCAYYGTVESQNRLTLHLHALLWVAHSLTPQEIRDRILSDYRFRSELIAWLERCHSGDYFTGDRDVIASRFEGGEYASDPSTTLPTPPPPLSSASSVDKWYSDFLRDVDSVLYSSNRHRCGKGCQRTYNGVKQCRARFPREIIPQTVVDLDSGALRFKKMEPFLNTFNPVLTYCLRCNTDVTCMLSGTHARAVVAYISDYITKTPLCAHAVFEAVLNVLGRSDDVLSEHESDIHKAQTILTRAVNSLTAKMETGGPMMALYQLGLPDHFKSDRFKVCFWSSYVLYTQRTDNMRSGLDAGLVSDDGAHHVDDENNDIGANERVVVGVANGRVVELNRVNDYLYRPEYFSSWCLYDYLVCSDTRALKKNCSADKSSITEHRFLDIHPLYSTHARVQLEERLMYTINFVGRALPHPNKGDRELYCRTMLVFFKPGGWRSGSDLKAPTQSWEDAFGHTTFTVEHLLIMKGMNVLRECNDSRDDLAAQRRRHPDSTVGVTFINQDDMDRIDSDNGEQRLLEDCTQDDLARHIVHDDVVVGKKTARKRLEMESMRHLLRGLHGSDILSSHDAIEESSTPVPYRSPSQWKDLLMQSKEQEVIKRLGMKPPSRLLASSQPLSHADPRWLDGVLILSPGISQNGDDARNIGETGVARPLQDATLYAVHDVLTQYSLNDEQQRAFMIVCDFVIHCDRKGLRMYLGGMGGTGKSQLIHALVCLLERRDETSRFVLVAPTGSAAALINGCTYHSLLGFGKGSSTDRPSSQTVLAKVRGRLQDIDLLFIDEISMISCSQLYHISAQLSKALNKPNESFGGLNVIVAGDFAQLRPAAPSESPLYSDSVNAWSDGLSLSAQRNAVGKALWHQFTTVVILRKNMRQRGMSVDDQRFRTMLENLRYKACTNDDINLIRSRIISPSDIENELTRPEFRNVAVITGLNSHRDAINMHSAERFAREHQQQLTHFYSIDRWASASRTSSLRTDYRAHCSVTDPMRNSDHITPLLQDILWRLPPSLTEHRPGILSLCKGMPVLLKHNEATELCVTNGAEGTVHAWSSFRAPSGHDVLDTLFVKLTNPPKPVQLDGLPLNVIPLSRNKDRIRCLLPTDSSVLIEREQVYVLPYFAMTDFCSQGRTRPFNVCHLTHCRNHQSIYTCLSRGSSLHGTVLIGRFDESKVRGGLSGALRHEFRHLELLDEITRLRYANDLPDEVCGVARSSLIASFHRWKGVSFVPKCVPKALDWSSEPSSSVAITTIDGQWRIVETRQSSASNQSKRNPVHSTACANDTSPALQSRSPLHLSVAAPQKHSRPADDRWTSAADQSATKRVCLLPDNSTSHNMTDYLPSGLIWDDRNYSCAYDAILYILWNMYREGSLTSVQQQLNRSSILAALLDGFSAATMDVRLLESVRNTMRDALHHINSARFPRYGSHLTVAVQVLEALLQPIRSAFATTTCCSHCGQSASHVGCDFVSNIVNVYPSS